MAGFGFGIKASRFWGIWGITGSGLEVRTQDLKQNQGLGIGVWGFGSGSGFRV